MRPGSWQFVRDQRPCADSRCKRERRGRPDRRTTQAAVGNDMLQGFIGVVQGDRSIVVMMVGFLLPVKHRVRDLLRIGERGRLSSDGKGLPKH